MRTPPTGRRAAPAADGAPPPRRRAPCPGPHRPARRRRSSRAGGSAPRARPGRRLDRSGRPRPGRTHTAPSPAPSPASAAGVPRPRSCASRPAASPGTPPGRTDGFAHARRGPPRGRRGRALWPSTAHGGCLPQGASRRRQIEALHVLALVVRAGTTRSGQQRLHPESGAAERQQAGLEIGRGHQAGGHDLVFQSGQDAVRQRLRNAAAIPLASAAQSVPLARCGTGEST